MIMAENNTDSPNGGNKPETAQGEERPRKKVKKQPYWVLYLSILLSGLVLIADAVSYAPVQKITARLGIALLVSALALIIGNGRTVGYAAAALIWIAVIVTFLV
jgi:hypothetical protein